MNVTQVNLNAWRSLAEQMRTHLLTLRHLLARRQDAAALQLMNDMNENLLLVGLDMEHAGAAAPGTAPRKFVAPPNMGDTRACHDLLASLCATRNAAQAVDAERYGAEEDGPYVLWLERLLVEVKAGIKSNAEIKSNEASDDTASSSSRSSSSSDDAK